MSITLLGVGCTISAVVAGCNWWVNRSAAGRVFNEIDAVPARPVAVILGTSPESRFGGPNLFYTARIRAAAELYQRCKFRHIIISGTCRPGYDETAMMRRDLLAQGVPDSVIFKDKAGDRTLLSMGNMKRAFGCDSIIVVSQRWHNQRSIFLARHLGIDAVGYNADDVHNRLAKLTHLREMLARVKACAEMLLMLKSSGLALAGMAEPLETKVVDINQTRAETSLGRRFPSPDGFSREQTKDNTFAHFLQNLPLKPAGSDLHYYEGSVKERAYGGAVVDIDFGYRYVEQCADAVIFLRALWLWETAQYERIAFNFTNGFRADYGRWARGERIHVNPRTWRCSWSKDARRDYGYKTFRSFLNMVFQYAGTASLEQEMEGIKVSELTVGDVLINGGHPGHAVIVVDVVRNERGEKRLLLAQGYTPAQEIEVFDHWFPVDTQAEGFATPNWYFRNPFAKRFR